MLKRGRKAPRFVDQEGAEDLEDLDLASASPTAAFAVALAGVPFR